MERKQQSLKFPLRPFLIRAKNKNKKRQELIVFARTPKKTPEKSKKIKNQPPFFTFRAFFSGVRKKTINSWRFLFLFFAPIRNGLTASKQRKLRVFYRNENGLRKNASEEQVFNSLGIQNRNTAYRVMIEMYNIKIKEKKCHHRSKQKS